MAHAEVRQGEHVFDDQVSKERETHWAYRPVKRPAVPEVRHKELVRSPIDAFLLARLEEKGLSFSLPAPLRFFAGIFGMGDTVTAHGGGGTRGE